MTTNKNIPGILLFSIVLTLFISACDIFKDPVVASFTVGVTDALTGDTLRFTNRSENASHYQWDFGDGGSSALKDPTHVYTDEGAFKVTLVSFNGDDSDSASLTIDVSRGYEITIFEGIGIEGTTIYDLWSEIREDYTTDTIYFSTYYEDLEAYLNSVYYYQEGLVFNFVSTDTIIEDDDDLRLIYIVLPYEGATSRGILVGSTMTHVKTVYGEPESEYEGELRYGYWYDSKGVDFYSYNTLVVDQIDIYNPITASSKSADNEQALLNEFRKTIGEYISHYRFPQ